jgi:hypothetical protein
MAKTKGKKTAGAKKSPAWKGGAPKAPVEKTAKVEKPAEPKISQAELDVLRKPVEAAKGALEKAQAEAKALAEKARAMVAEAKDAYRTALAPYLPAPARGAGGQAGREACQKAGIECEYLPAPRQVASRQAGEGGRSANVSE